MLLVEYTDIPYETISELDAYKVRIVHSLSGGLPTNVKYVYKVGLSEEDEEWLKYLLSIPGQHSMFPSIIVFLHTVAGLSSELLEGAERFRCSSYEC